MSAHPILLPRICRHLGPAKPFLLLLLAAPMTARDRPAREPVDLTKAVQESRLPLAEFRAPLTEEMRKLAGDGRVSPIREARCLVGTPPGFNPARPWPVLFVSATTDRGYNSSNRLLLKFAGPALAAGWVVLAADPADDVEPAQDRIGLRHALLLAALDHLRHDWPGMTRWPRAYAGFSGGAKISGYLAAVSTDAGQTPCGVYLAGCNEDTLTRAMKSLSLPPKAMTGIPVFLSSGLDDPIATPNQHGQVLHSLHKTGFVHVELKSFPGRHEVHADHITAALAWFTQLATASPAAGATK
ncbi:MAG TPA: hypothetical protein VG734_07890 [Lacunisphaera sp.]|nr:hypothetical protein [Lacunisphaera sp.]